MEKELVVEALMIMEGKTFESERRLFTLYKVFQDGIREKEGYCNKGEVFENSSDFFKDQFQDDIMETLHTISKKHYDVDDPYIQYNEYMELESGKWLFNMTSVSDMAQYIIDNEQKMREKASWEMSCFDDEYEKAKEDKR